MTPAVRQLLLGRRRLAPYLGQVATHSFTPSNFAAASKQMMNRTSHVATSDVTQLQLVFASWQGAEVLAGANATITASVEYPAGTFTQVLFSGVAQGAIIDGSYVVSDVAAVSIPKGAAFWTRSYYTNTAGIVYAAPSTDYPSLGDGMTFAASGVVDQTMGGVVANTAPGVWYGPAAIIAITTSPTFLLIGDSRVAGTGDTSPTSGVAVGELARSVSAYGNSNMGAPGSTAQVMAGQGASGKRALLSQYFSHVLSNFGINDLVSRTADQLLADNLTIRYLMPTKPFYLSTVSPRSTSTDAWATLVNQTTHPSNAARVTYNNYLRAGIAGLSGFLEVADAVESSRDSGLWKVPGYTADGLHESATGYLAILSSGAINPAAIVRR